jgi:hypothetical protein
MNPPNPTKMMHHISSKVVVAVCKDRYAVRGGHTARCLGDVGILAVKIGCSVTLPVGFPVVPKTVKCSALAFCPPLTQFALSNFNH